MDVARRRRFRARRREYQCTLMLQYKHYFTVKNTISLLPVNDVMLLETPNILPKRAGPFHTQSVRYLKQELF